MSTESYPAAEALARRFPLSMVLGVNPTVKELYGHAEPTLDEERARRLLSARGLDCGSAAMAAAMDILRARVARLSGG